MKRIMTLLLALTMLAGLAVSAALPRRFTRPDRRPGRPERKAER